MAAVLTAVAGSAAAADSAPAPIATIQAQLAALGYDPGPRNGVMSAKTERALLAYRHAAGHPLVTGPAADPVAAAQQALRQLGLLSAPADGAIGPRTRDAIVRFQAESHLAVDPRVSDQLLAELDQATRPPATQPRAIQPLGSAPANPSPEGSEAQGSEAQGSEPQGSQAPAPAEPEATGREPLPAGVRPPPIH